MYTVLHGILLTQSLNTVVNHASHSVLIRCISRGNVSPHMNTTLHHRIIGSVPCKSDIAQAVIIVISLSTTVSHR